MTNATFSHRPHTLPVTRLRLGRVLLLLVVGATAGVTGIPEHSSFRLGREAVGERKKHVPLNGSAGRPWIGRRGARP